MATMSVEPVHLFLNPTAGRGRARRRMARIHELLRGSDIPVELHTSSEVGDLESRVLAEVDNGASRIVVAGGDGSVYEAVNGILASSGSASLGLVPTGTGNDFAKGCDIPLNWEHAARLLADRLRTGQHARTIDVGIMNGRYFANGAGIGFDAKVTRLARSYRLPIGDIVYLLAIFRAMLDGIATPRLEISTGEFSWDGPATLAAISNGPWIGGMFHIAPMASNSDGKLEMLIADPVTRRRILSLLPKLMSGEHIKEPEIHHVSVTQLTVTAAEPLPSHLDGEVQPLYRHFDIRLLPGALRLL
ncbi:MAG: diacylglycerol kinase family lipid kinase [Gammaproteobacteria bacterium]|nr:diacylglycerol kinase family lipid kinase [Gammaproteobacteria bacterium]